MSTLSKYYQEAELGAAVQYTKQTSRLLLRHSCRVTNKFQAALWNILSMCLAIRRWCLPVRTKYHQFKAVPQEIRQSAHFQQNYFTLQPGSLLTFTQLWAPWWFQILQRRVVESFLQQSSDRSTDKQLHAFRCSSPFSRWCAGTTCYICNELVEPVGAGKLCHKWRWVKYEKSAR